MEDHTMNTEFTIRDRETPIAREALVHLYMPCVRTLARRLRFRVPPSVSIDDLVSAGAVGLLQAIDRFEPARGLQFRTYARHRIWGAMLDFLRGEDPLSRTERRRRQVAAASEPDRTAPPPATVSLEDFPAHEMLSVLAPTHSSETAAVNRATLAEARQCLSARENRVISLLYELDWKSREVALALHVNESRISQIKGAALSKLRTRLEANASPRAA
jgi:RNA polymerase sigma factor for flagellar operon FliA